MRIGIFCDTINPITNAHLTMIEAAKLQMKLDFVYIFPTNITPAKDQETIAPLTDRISMAKIKYTNILRYPFKIFIPPLIL